MFLCRLVLLIGVVLLLLKHRILNTEYRTPIEPNGAIHMPLLCTLRTLYCLSALTAGWRRPRAAHQCLFPTHIHIPTHTHTPYTRCRRLCLTRSLAISPVIPAKSQSSIVQSLTSWPTIDATYKISSTILFAFFLSSILIHFSS